MVKRNKNLSFLHKKDTIFFNADMLTLESRGL